MPEDKWLDQHLLPFECCWAEALQGVLWGRGLQQGQARPRQSSRKQGWAHTARAPHRLGIPNTWNSLELSSGFHKAKSFVSGGLATASSPAQHSNLACSALSDQYSTQERGKKAPRGIRTPWWGGAPTRRYLSSKLSSNLLRKCRAHHATAATLGAFW